MSIIEQNVSVNMLRWDVDDFPCFPLPDGFIVRWFEPDDVDLWVELYSLADEHNEITHELFYREFGEDPEVWDGRIFFLEDGAGNALGTAAAWYDEGFMGECWGRIHWVAIIPEAQGKGLAKPLMSIVCDRFKVLGHDKVYLVTSTARVPAINLYRKFGFIPDVLTEEKEKIWREFSKETGITFFKEL